MERRRLLLLAYVIILRMRRRRRARNRKNRSFWVRELFRARDEKGAYTQIMQEIRLNDRESHFKYVKICNVLY